MHKELIDSPVYLECLKVSTSSALAVLGFLDQDYRFKSVATLTLDNVWLLSILSAGNGTPDR